MYYSLQLKNIKQSAKNLGLYLKEKNLSAPQHVILDALARTFFYKNWNTLEGMTNQPHIIEHIKLKNRYLIECEIRVCSRHELLSILKQVWSDSGFTIHIANLIEQNQHYHIEIDIKSKNFHDNQTLSEETFDTCMRVFEQHMAAWLISLEYCIIACTKRKLTGHDQLAPETENNEKPERTENKKSDSPLVHKESSLSLLKDLGYSDRHVLEKIKHHIEDTGNIMIGEVVGSGMSHTLRDFFQGTMNEFRQSQDTLKIAQTGHKVYTTVSSASTFDTLERIIQTGGMGQTGQQIKTQQLKKTLENLVMPEQFAKNILAKTLGSDTGKVVQANHAAMSGLDKLWDTDKTNHVSKKTE